MGLLPPCPTFPPAPPRLHLHPKPPPPFPLPFDLDFVDTIKAFDDQPVIVSLLLAQIQSYLACLLTS